MEGRLAKHFFEDKTESELPECMGCIALSLSSGCVSTLSSSGSAWIRSVSSTESESFGVAWAVSGVWISGDKELRFQQRFLLGCFQ